jgi:Glutamine amidotransferase domain
VDGRERLAGVTSDRFLVHLRRPSRLSTVQLADTQPFVAEDGSFAFCHNGMLDRHEEHRQRLGSSLAGKADSEVGFRMTQEALAAGATPTEALADAYGQLGGRANLGYLGADGELAVFAVNATNRLWSFGVDGASGGDGAALGRPLGLRAGVRRRGRTRRGRGRGGRRPGLARRAQGGLTSTSSSKRTATNQTRTRPNPSSDRRAR